MTNTKDTKAPSPIEVWLRPTNPGSRLTEYTCMVVRPDETTHDLDVDSMSLRGAEREMTGWFITQGYEPVGRWQSEDEEEAYRVFRLVKT